MSEQITLDDIIGRAVDLQLDDGRWCYGIVVGIDQPEDSVPIELGLAPVEYIPVYNVQHTRELVAHLKLEELPTRIRKIPPEVYLNKNVLRIIEWGEYPRITKKKAEEQYGRFLKEHPEFVTLYHRSKELDLRVHSDGIYGYLVQAQLQRKPVLDARDTHFAGFAKLLVDELKATGGYPISEVEQIIARRAYDLVEHTLENTAHIDLDRLSTDEHVLRIPDLTELSKD